CVGSGEEDISVRRRVVCRARRVWSHTAEGNQRAGCNCGSVAFLNCLLIPSNLLSKEKARFLFIAFAVLWIVAQINSDAGCGVPEGGHFVNVMHNEVGAPLSGYNVPLRDTNKDAPGLGIAGQLALTGTHGQSSCARSYRPGH